MTNLVSNSKSKTTATNSLRSSNSSNLADLNNKMQNTYLVGATVSEIRPGGDVILSTSHGMIRSASTFTLSVGDKVTARVAYADDGEIKANIVDVKNNSKIPTIKPQTASPLLKYLSEIISGNKSTNNTKTQAILAKFSYMAPNRNLLRYGHINPGDQVKVQLLPQTAGKHQTDIVAGSVISNDSGFVSINSTIGIINLQTDANLQPSQKILLRIIDLPNNEQVAIVGDSILKLMNTISNNIDMLKAILSANRGISDIASYKKLLHLVTTQHDSATLAKLFHQTRNIPDSDVERWIDEEIVEPFEAYTKGNKLTILTQEFQMIESQLAQMNIAPGGGLWHSIPISVNNTDQKATLNVKADGDTINFLINANHAEFGAIILSGTIELHGKNRHISSISFNIKHTNKFPIELLNSITSIFTEHRNISNIEGSIDFATL